MGSIWIWEQYSHLINDGNITINIGLNYILRHFENADISLNGRGKNIVYISGKSHLHEGNLFKEEIIENGINYTVYKDIDGEYTRIFYTLFNVLHRVNKPAYIRTYAYNEEKETAYFKNGKLHRDDGPAVVILNKKEILASAYWINDKKITDKEYNIIQRKKKLEKLCQKYL